MSLVENINVELFNWISNSLQDSIYNTEANRSKRKKLKKKANKNRKTKRNRKFT